MFAATIVPQSYLHLVKDQPYHLALAHLIDKPGFEDYSNFYFNMGHAPDKFLILDNGLIEGDPRPIEEIIEKAEWLGASEIVLPDVFQDMFATLKASEAALKVVRDRAPHLNVMVVPQGKDMDQWLICAAEILNWGVDTISVPKVVTKMAGRDGRLEALTVMQESLARNNTEVHLLGCWDSPLELKLIENHVRSGNIKPVRGVDSAIAYVYARAGLKMSEDERPSGAINFAANDAHELILKYNIEMWQSECGSLPSFEPGETPVHRLW